MLDNLDLREVIAVVGVFAAMLTALISLITVRWSKHAFTAKDSEISQLKQQIAGLKEVTPAELRKQLVALRESFDETTIQLRADLTETNQRLRDKSGEVSENQLKISFALGWGKLLLGVNDGELMARRLSGLLFHNHGVSIDYGEQDLNIRTFYLQAMQLSFENDESRKEIVSSSPEWILDFVILPLCSIMHYKTLCQPAKALATKFCTDIEESSYRHEVPIYKKAIEQAFEGVEFKERILPIDLQAEMDKAYEQKKLQ